MDFINIDFVKTDVVQCSLTSVLSIIDVVQFTLTTIIRKIYVVLFLKPSPIQSIAHFAHLSLFLKPKLLLKSTPHTVKSFHLSPKFLPFTFSPKIPFSSSHQILYLLVEIPKLHKPLRQNPQTQFTFSQLLLLELTMVSFSRVKMVHGGICGLCKSMVLNTFIKIKNGIYHLCRTFCRV